jgi:hypothetical protein
VYIDAIQQWAVVRNSNPDDLRNLLLTNSFLSLSAVLCISREGPDVKRGAMLKQFEKIGRGQSGVAAALPEQLHRQTESFLL